MSSGNNARRSNGGIDHPPSAPARREKSPAISDFFGNLLTILMIIDFVALVIQGMNPFGWMNNPDVSMGFSMFIAMFPLIVVLIVQVVKNRE